MIARAWSGTTRPENAAAYARYLQENILPELSAIDGHRGALVLRRDADGAVEFEVLSLWESLEAVRRFAGDPPERAVVPAEAQALLERFDPEARHYDVVAAPEPRSG